MRTEVHPDAPPGAALLRSWLDAQGINIPQFCERCGLERVTVQRLLSGDRGKRMSLELAAAIDDATGGAVPARAWLHPPPPPDGPTVDRSGDFNQAGAP